MRALVIFGGLLLLGLGQASCLTGTSAKDAKAAEIQYDLGVNELQNGRLTEALRAFLDSSELNPRFPQVHNALGLAYYLLGDFPKALASFDQALVLKPDWSEAIANKARVQVSQGRFREAVPLLQKALDDVFLPERYLAESNLGWSLFQIGEEEEGFRKVKNAVAQNEKFCVGYEYLGLMHQSQKNIPEATKEFRKVAEICPEYPAGLRSLGKILLMAGDVEAGCQTLQTCLQKSRMTEVGQECERLVDLSCPKTSRAPAGNHPGQ